ncbi:hypothetical protein QAD02_001532 [Eretmocerus hayati]|uniref:Uncharacterized protein n=1 Tax=Eretmocerus hayati TaxID=131215 RepID=A0ACC2NH85_9HYME|nr:hypothetical protein QAD02_001532 [Eretmocerus hayati]
MTKIVDLRPDRNLLNPNFEKYQFSSDTFLHKYEKSLQTEILRRELGPTQDSYLEARLFAFHNHLFKSPYDSTCWFIDKHGGIWKFTSEELLELIHTSKTITEISSECIYNPSMAFASQDMIVICNGSGTLEFLVQTSESLKNISIGDLDPAVILDARFIKEMSKIIVALYRIEENEGKRFSRLTFLTYDYDVTLQNLKLHQKQMLKVKGVIEYVYIEDNGRYFQIISQDQAEFEYDSLNSIERSDGNSVTESQINIPKYCWSQDEDSITVYMKINEKLGDTPAKVEVTPTSVSIQVGNSSLLNGDTPHRLESDLTTWKRNGNTLEIELSKSENGLMWNELLKGDTGGEYLPNEALADEVHSRLAHLCSSVQESNSQGHPTIGFNSEQLEECDLSGAENILQRINFTTHTATHIVMIGSSNRIIFCEKRNNEQVICLRHDHDGCLWSIKDSPTVEWELKHTCTYPGFGYVEASKTNKKFCSSPPNQSFISIVEHTRHIFLYEKPRKDSTIGKQRILDLGSESSPVLGAISTDKSLIILTKDVLYQLQVY